MVLATPNIREALSGTYDETIIAENGQRVAEMTPRLQQAIDDDAPAAVIVNLGTNDAVQGRSSARAVSDFERLVETTAEVPCVVLTTLSTTLDASFENSVATELNARIRKLRANDPNRYQVVDWDAAVSAPGGAARLMADPASGISDGVHENATAGRQWFADEYVEALSRCHDLDRP
jgi:lysophospholipase L1-like esterase